MIKSNIYQGYTLGLKSKRLDGQKSYDVSISRQKSAINIINDDIKALKRLCQEYQREMPTQIKLIYDVISNRLNADYRYDIVFSNDQKKTAYDVLEEWYQLEKSKEEKRTYKGD